MTFDEAWELGRWGFIGEDSAERMNQFVDDRSVISKLTESECKRCKDSARRKAGEKGSYYGDFAMPNFTKGNKGELGVLKYLHTIRPFGHLESHIQQIMQVKQFGDGGIDISWGGRRIDVKCTGPEYGPLVADSHRGRADVYILSHLKFDGFNRQEKGRCWADPDRVIIYGFIFAEEFYETYEEDGKDILKRAVHYDNPPTKYKVECWMLRPMSEIEDIIIEGLRPSPNDSTQKEDHVTEGTN